MVNAMATPATSTTTTVYATVREIYSGFGVAYVADSDERTWGVSRATPGATFDALKPGRQVRLAIRAFENSSIVAEYGLID